MSHRGEKAREQSKAQREELERWHCDLTDVAKTAAGRSLFRRLIVESGCNTFRANALEMAAASGRRELANELVAGLKRANLQLFASIEAELYKENNHG